MVLDEQTVMLWLGRFLWPFLRLTGLFLTAPILGSTLIPNLVKSLLAAGLAFCLAMWLPQLPAFPGDPFSAMLTGMEQIAYGALLGMVMQMMVAAIACAGEIAGLAMGLSFAELVFRDSPGASPVLYNIMLWAGVMAYLATGGPAWLLAALAHSFDHGAGIAPVASWGSLALMGGTLFATATSLALPVLAISLCVNITVGLTTVFSPSMNLLTIGFPVLILAGLWAMAASVPAIGMAALHLSLVCEQALSALLPHG